MKCLRKPVVFLWQHLQFKFSCCLKTLFGQVLPFPRIHQEKLGVFQMVELYCLKANVMVLGLLFLIWSIWFPLNCSIGESRFP